MNFKPVRATAAVCVALFGLSACWQDGDSRPGIHVEAPLDISKAGNRLTLDFEAKPGSAGPYNVYMVNLTFNRTEAKDPLVAMGGKPPKGLFPFKVSVVHFVDGKEVPVELIDGHQFIGEIEPSRYLNFVPEDRQAVIYYSLLYASTGTDGYICLIRFLLKEPGKYRAKIETIQDQRIFENVNSMVSVKNEFSFGK